MRDWILEMRQHSDAVSRAISAKQLDEAWRLTHIFQAWCIERINTEQYSHKDAGTLLSAPQEYLVQLLDSEGKGRLALVHLIFQGVLDGRNLKFYPKEIAKRFKKCDFFRTTADEALKLYEAQKASPQPWDRAFIQIRDAAAYWA